MIPTNNHIEPGGNITPITPKQAGPVDSKRVSEEVKGGQGTPVRHGVRPTLSRYKLNKLF